MGKKAVFLVNGRSAVHADSQGQLITVDVCDTPSGSTYVPVPYTNIAESRDADKTAEKEMVDGHPLCHAESEFSHSTGDEAGSGGGIHSGVIQGKAIFKSASDNVFFEGKGAVRAFDEMVSNDENTDPTPLIQPSGAATPVWVDSLVAEALEEEPPPRWYACDLLDGSLPRLDNALAVTSESWGNEEGDEDWLRVFDRAPRRVLDAPAALHGQHRVLSLPAREEDGQAALAIKSLKRDDFFVPLGPVAAEESAVLEEQSNNTAGSLDSVIAPVLIRVSTSPEGDYRPPTPDTCLYVCRDGYLWRELVADDKGHWREVNLAEKAGRDRRSPDAWPGTPWVELPLKWNGREPKIELAYSHIPWPWAWIEALGGLDLHDPRRGDHRAGHGAHGRQYSREPAFDCNTLSCNTFYRVTLDAVLNHAEEPPAGTARIVPASSADEATLGVSPDELLGGAEAAIVTLDSPIDVALTLANEANAALDRYHEAVVASKSGAGIPDEQISAWIDQHGEDEELIGQKMVDYLKAAEIIEQVAHANDKLGKRTDFAFLDRVMLTEQQETALAELEAATERLLDWMENQEPEGHWRLDQQLAQWFEHPDSEWVAEGLAIAQEIAHPLIVSATTGERFCEQLEQGRIAFLDRILDDEGMSANWLSVLMPMKLGAAAHFVEGLATGAQVNRALHDRVFHFINRVLSNLDTGEIRLEKQVIDLGEIISPDNERKVRVFGAGQVFTDQANGRRVQFRTEQWVVAVPGREKPIHAMGRSVDWLKRNHALATGSALGLLAVIEVYNFAAALRQSRESNGAKELEAGASFFRLTGIFFQFLKDVKGVGSGWESPQVSDHRKKVLRVQRGSVIVGTHGFAAVGHAMAAAADWHRTRKALVEGDPAAMGYAVRVLGNSVMFASSVMEGAAEMRAVSRRLFRTGYIGRFAARAAMRVPLFAGFGVAGMTRAVLGGWVGLLLYIVGTVMVMAFHVTPLERLVRESPFSKARGPGGQRQRVLSGGRPQWLEPEGALKELQRLLMSPMVAPEAKGQGYTPNIERQLDRNIPQRPGWDKPPEVKVYCPVWEPGRSRLLLQLSNDGRDIRLPQVTPRRISDGATVFSWAMDESLVPIHVSRPASIFSMRLQLDLYGDGEVIIPSDEDDVMEFDIVLRDVSGAPEFPL